MNRMDRAKCPLPNINEIFKLQDNAKALLDNNEFMPILNSVNSPFIDHLVLVFLCINN